MTEHEEVITEQLLNIDIPDKCVMCPHFFNYECQASQCEKEE